MLNKKIINMVKNKLFDLILFLFFLIFIYNNMNNISIGYLSWKRHTILNQTLLSHKNNGLFDLIKQENRYIFFQEFSEEDKKIANNYKCNYFGDKENIGILNAFIKLVEKCETEFFIFSENDWFLVENKEITNKILEDCVELLKNNKCDIIKLRHRTKHGKPLYSKPKNTDEWLKQNINCFPYKLESLSWIEKPNEAYNNLFTEFKNNYTWYITTLQHQLWSNNIFIAKTSYLKEIVLPLIKHFETKNDKYLGLENILINYKNFYSNNETLNNVINLFKKTKIGAGEGLFEHKDYI
jgi:hypothetical protein